MKTLIGLLALVVLFTLTACGDSFDAEAEQETLESIAEEIKEAHANSDGEVLRRYLHEGYENFYSDETVALIIARRAWLQGAYYGWTSTVNSSEWMIGPNIAVRKSLQTWQPPDGSEEHWYSTEVFEKEDGQWYLVHQHWSYAP